METFALIPVTIASILGAYSGNSSTVEEAVINTHMSPEIAGLWEIDLPQDKKATAAPAAMATPSLPGMAVAKRAGNNEQASRPDNTLNNMPNSEPDNSATRELTAPSYANTATATDTNKAAKAAVAINAEPVTIHTTTTVQLAKQQAIPVCHERYNFAADNKVVTTSGAEWTLGEYLYQYSDEGLPVLAMTTVYDNNEVDCAGQRVDQSGEAILAYVDYQADTHKMRWCADAAGLQCFISLHRLLP